MIRSVFRRWKVKKHLYAVFGSRRADASGASRDLPAFRRRMEYEDYRPEDYTLYPGLAPEHLLPLLEAHLDSMLEGYPDQSNGDFVDSLIFTPARLAVPDLSIQQHRHNDALHRLIARREADREDFAQILAQREQELQELNAAHAATLEAIERFIGKEHAQ